LGAIKRGGGNTQFCRRGGISTGK